MKSNSLTLSQAHKIYTGDSMGLYALKLSIGGILMYSATLASFIILGLLEEGSFVEAMKELRSTPTPNVFLMLDIGIILTIFGLMSYEKQYPGGKLFRTVKGGFDTYIKMKNANLIIRITAMIFVLAFSAMLDTADVLRLTGGPKDLLFIGSCLLAGLWLVNLTSLIKNPAVKGALSVIVMFGAGVCGIIFPRISNSLTIPLITVIVSIPLVIITHMALLKSYKKHYWDN